MKPKKKMAADTLTFLRADHVEVMDPLLCDLKDQSVCHAPFQGNIESKKKAAGEKEDGRMPARRKKKKPTKKWHQHRRIEVESL